MDVLVDMTNQESRRMSIGLSNPGVRYQDNEKILNGTGINGANADDTHYSMAASSAQENLQPPEANGVGHLQTMYGRNGENNPRSHLQRKPSSPMMPAFMVSAPGKVIVFGEHAVVHGKVRLTFHYQYVAMIC